MLYVLSFAVLSSHLSALELSDIKGLTGTELQQALHTIISDHSPQTYSSLWTHFQTTDKKPNGKVWDMYSDLPDGTAPYEYDFGTDQCGNYSGENDCYNREHSFPASWFNDSEPAYTDLHHLYPTDGYVNNRRGNYPFGEVGTATWTSRNGSRVGASVSPGYSGTVFEPIDSYKGDFARSILYMAVRYYGEDSAWPGSGMTDGSQPENWAVELLRSWDKLDPVSSKETLRNDAVESIQGNRNPFTDIPYLSGLIWSGLAWPPESLSIDSSYSPRVLLRWQDISSNESGFRILVNGSEYAVTGADTDSLFLEAFTPGDSLTVVVQALTENGETSSEDLRFMYPMSAQLPYTFMAYNLENYGERFPGDHSRNDDLRHILTQVPADAVMLCEVWAENGAFEVLRDSVFQRLDSRYSLVWLDQATVYQDIGCAYRSDRFEMLSLKTVNISESPYLRDAFELRLKDLSYGREFLLLGLHLKANSYSDNDGNLATRAEQTDALRNYLSTVPDSIPRFVMGDLNMLNGSELGWQNLTGSRSDDSGRLFDPPQRSGEWNNNPAFSDVHSYSADDLDTRFDFILHSREAEDGLGVSYLDGSYRVVGNDGDRYSGSVGDMPNDAADAALAAALLNTSDHLPVTASYRFGPWSGSSGGSEDSSHYLISENFENGWGDWTVNSVRSDKNWILSSDETGAEGSQYSAYINGYGADDASEDWLISPEFSLGNAESAELTYYVNGRYSGNVLQVLISGNYSSSEASWQLLTVHGPSGSSSWTGWTAARLDLSTWLEQDALHIAFKYSSSGTAAGEAAAYMIDLVRIQAEIITGTAVEDNPLSPEQFVIVSAFPNPFNSRQNIHLFLNQPGDLSFSVYDIRGRQLEQSLMKVNRRGPFTLHWDAGQASSGLYLLKVVHNDQSQVFRSVLMK